MICTTGWQQNLFNMHQFDNTAFRAFHIPRLFIFSGIPPHVDTHSAFEDTILSLSLGAKVRSQSGICDLIVIILTADL